MSAALERRTIARGVPPVGRVGLAGSFGIKAADVERGFHELGVNYFFVSTRMKGLCAGIRNLVAAGHRDEIVIAAGANLPVGATVSWELSRTAKALNVETIDVFHLFWVQANWYVAGKTWPALEKMKEDGRARALAVSCHDRPRARRFVDELNLDVLMIRYNAAHRGAEREIFESLDGGARPGIVAYTATRWGRLLKPAKGLGPMTAPECYRFALSHPMVDVVLCGAETYDQLADDVRAVRDGPIPDQRMKEIHRFGDAVRATATGRIGFMGG